MCTEKQGVPFPWECLRNSDSGFSHLITTEIPGAWLRGSREKTREMLLTIYRAQAKLLRTLLLLLLLLLLFKEMAPH